MSKYDEEMAAIIGKAILRPDLRQEILADPARALAGTRLPTEYQDRLLAGLEELDRAGVQSEVLARKLGTNAWGVGGSVL